MLDKVKDFVKDEVISRTLPIRPKQIERRHSQSGPQRRGSLSPRPAPSGADEPCARSARRRTYSLSRATKPKPLIGRSGGGQHATPPVSEWQTLPRSARSRPPLPDIFSPSDRGGPSDSGRTKGGGPRPTINEGTTPPPHRRPAVQFHDPPPRPRPPTPGAGRKPAESSGSSRGPRGRRTSLRSPSHPSFPRPSSPSTLPPPFPLSSSTCRPVPTPEALRQARSRIAALQLDLAEYKRRTELADAALLDAHLALAAKEAQCASLTALLDRMAERVRAAEQDARDADAARTRESEAAADEVALLLDNIGMIREEMRAIKEFAGVERRVGGELVWRVQREEEEKNKVEMDKVKDKVKVKEKVNEMQTEKKEDKKENEVKDKGTKDTDKKSEHDNCLKVHAKPRELGQDPLQLHDSSDLCASADLDSSDDEYQDALEELDGPSGHCCGERRR